jgi:phage-related minor tail protein
MTVRLESLRVQADMDASAYVQGAAEKAQADQKMVDSAQAVDAAVQKTERTISQSTSGLDKVRNQLDKSAKAAADYAVAVSRINTAYEKGRITAPGTRDALSGPAAQAERDRLLKLAKERYSPSNQNSFGGNFSYTDAEILRSGAINVVQSLGAGMGVGRTLETQFFQTAPALPALFSAIGGGAIAATTAITVLAAAMAVIGYRAVSIQTELRKFNVALLGMGRNGEMSANQLHGYVELMRDTGFDKDEAITSAMQIARSKNINGRLGGQISGAISDFAAGSGLSTGDATKSLVDIATKGWPAIQQLDEQYRFLTTDEYAHIKALEEQGRQMEATSEAIVSLQRRFKDLSTLNRGEVAQSFHDLGRSFDNFVDHVASSDGWKHFIEGFSVMSRFVIESWQGSLFGYDSLGKKTKDQSSAEENSVQAKNEADRTIAEKMRVDFNEDLSKKQEIYGVSPGSRYLIQSRQEAEHDALNQNMGPSQKQAYVEGKVGLARAEHVGAISDQNTELQKNISLTMSAAQAYTESAASGVRADMQKTAALDAWKTGIDQVTHAQQLLSQWVAQAALSGAQSLNTLRLQVAATQNSARAAAISAQAEEEATLQEKIRQATLQQTTAMELASGQQKEELAQQIAETTRNIRLQAAAEKELSHNRTMREGTRDLGYANAELSIAQSGASDGEVRKMQLQLEQMKKLDELRDKYGSNTGMINEEMGLFVQKQNVDEMTRMFNEIKEQSRQVSSEMASSFISGFKESANQGHTIYKNVMAGILNIAEDASEKLAKMLLEKAIFDPIASGLVSSLPSMFGIASSASSSSTSSSTSSGLFSGFFSALGFRAGGGETYAGNPYVVGENGKELFIPKTNGTIVSNSNLAQSTSSSPNFNFDVKVNGAAAGNPKLAQQSGNAFARAAKAEIINILQEQQRFGGVLYR